MTINKGLSRAMDTSARTSSAMRASMRIVSRPFEAKRGMVGREKPCRIHLGTKTRVGRRQSSSGGTEAESKLRTLDVSKPTRRMAASQMASLLLFRHVYNAEEASAEQYTRKFRERFETSISSATLSYTFEIPPGWKEQLVSLNDGKLYGVDLRFTSEDGNANLAVAVLPYAGREEIQEAGPPEEAFETFAPLLTPMLTGEGDADVELRIVDENQESVGQGSEAKTFYCYELTRPHAFVKAHVAEGLLYLFTATANDRQWRNYKDALRDLTRSFNVPKS